MSSLFGRRGGGRDGAGAHEERDAQSLAAVEAGGIPLAAQERLDQLRARGGRFFTSDLEVDEFLLVREGGFEPVTQVMGTSVYHVGWQFMPYASSWSFAAGGCTELDTQTEAWNEARRLALGRLRSEAARAGADAVVGVRLSRAEFDWSQGLIEFASFGTAVRSRRYDLGDEPVLSNLSGQEFAKLYAHGWWPVGLVAATTVVYVVASWQTQNAQQGFFASMRNQELTDYTQGMYEARALAMRRAQQQAHECGAHGLVGVRIEQHQHEHEVDQNGKRTDLIVELHVLGTAVVELQPDGEPPPTYIAVGIGKETQ
ncbi:MAG TPA: heavy metal-binding domain-containing protein [Gaiellaceae bacterium]|nr:heavy metal-binding domain-containing protein [Gaiellaceae bacterium]